MELQQDFDKIFDYFNEHFFENRLPKVVFNVYHKTNICGSMFRNHKYRLGERKYMSEIAINPNVFANLSPLEQYASIFYQMCHLWQHRMRYPSRNGYVNRELAEKLRDFGIVTFNLENKNKKTGDKVHYVIDVNGLFAKKLPDFPKIETQFTLTRKKRKSAPRKTPLRLKHKCPRCEDVLWMKKNMQVKCMKCELKFVESQ